MSATTAVALYDRIEDAGRVVRALHDAGVPDDAVSLLAGEDAGRRLREEAPPEAAPPPPSGKAAAVGAAIGGTGGLLVGLIALTVPGLGPVLALGPVAAALGGASAGLVAGGIAGVMSGMGVAKSDIELYEAGLNQGGALVIVHTDDHRAAMVRAILDGRPADAPADPGPGAGGADWATTGQAPFDETPGPMTTPRPQQEGQGSDRAPAARSSVHRTGMAADTAGARGADWGTSGQAPFDERPGPFTTPRPQRSATGTCDDTEFAQAGCTSGVRGAATAFGGVEREKAKSGPVNPAPDDTLKKTIAGR